MVEPLETAPSVMAVGLLVESGAVVETDVAPTGPVVGVVTGVGVIVGVGGVMIPPPPPLLVPPPPPHATSNAHARAAPIPPVRNVSRPFVASTLIAWVIGGRPV